MSDDDFKGIKNVKDLTQEVLDGITAREAKILRERFGIELDKDSNLKEIAKQFDVTRERIRKIEEKALKKLHGGDDDPDAA